MDKSGRLVAEAQGYEVRYSMTDDGTLYIWHGRKGFLRDDGRWWYTGISNIKYFNTVEEAEVELAKLALLEAIR